MALRTERECVRKSVCVCVCESLNDGKEGRKTGSDCQFNLRGPQLTVTTNFESTLWKENGYTEACGVRQADKTFIFKPPLVKVLYVISHCRISPHPEGHTK